MAALGNLRAVARELRPSPGVQRLLEEYWETSGDDLAFAARAEIDVRTWRRWKVGEVSPSDAKLHDVRRRLEVFRLAERTLAERGDTVAAPTSPPVAVEAGPDRLPTDRDTNDEDARMLDTPTVIFNIVRRMTTEEQDRALRAVMGAASPPGDPAPLSQPATRRAVLGSRRKYR